jgi:hypothetical protein
LFSNPSSGSSSEDSHDNCPDLKLPALSRYLDRIIAQLNLGHAARSMVDMVGSKTQEYQGTEMETRTREKGNFLDIEAKLPDIKLNIAPDHRSSKVTDLLSYLGSHNPLPKEVTGDDTVWLLDNTAYRSGSTDQWQAEFIAAVFDQNSGVEVSKVVADIAEKVGIGKGDAAEATIQERLIPFVQAILPGRKVKVNFAQKEEIDLGPGGRNAISSDTRVLPQYRDGDIVSSVAQVPSGTNGELNMQTVYSEPYGWGVISGMSFEPLLVDFRILTLHYYRH